MENKIEFSFRYLIPKVLYACLTSMTACDTADDKLLFEDKILIDKGASNINLEVKSGTDNVILASFLAFPSATPAKLKTVMVMHGSGGPWDDDDTNGDGIADLCHPGQLSNQSEAWKNLLIANGFAVVFVDSYSSRGTCENEGDYKKPPLKFKISGTFVRNRDAYDVLTMLSKLTWKDSEQPVIDMNNVAILGFSDGGTSVISTLYDVQATPPSWVWKQSFDGVVYTNEILPPPAVTTKFKTGVIYYPGAYHNGYYGNVCTDKGIYRSYADVMIHLAGGDPLTENSECLITTMQRLGGGTATVHRYADADHGFDNNDEPESSLARERTVLFLKSKLQ
ncbi:MAG TPA: alpha/beta hydrolase [Chryseosolibacter sp.]